MLRVFLPGPVLPGDAWRHVVAELGEVEKLRGAGGDDLIEQRAPESALLLFPVLGAAAAAAVVAVTVKRPTA